ncbi:uncharacterized protein LOC122659331 [Telopea speciosissima]|uniref:uncharacterized protein LOC122659331 n=1 Tax=Telopea speciosissima TaxID=54955 RepID=UPI001CC47AE9|nr:uncharacterized protein LOC122659331 [Telopea speciosissima]
MVLSWILNVLDKNISHSVIYIDSAHAVWTGLKQRFSRSNAPRIFQLKHSIATIQHDTDSLSIYYTRLMMLWDELTSYNPVLACTCGAHSTLHTAVQQEQVYQFLMGLSDSAVTIHSQILTIEPLPDVNQVYHLLLQEEQQRALTVTVAISDTAAMTAPRPSFAPSKTFGKGRPFCDHCKAYGHYRSTYWQLHGYPPS